MSGSLLSNFLVMLVSPVIGLYYGLLHRSYFYKRWILIFFITVYGSIIIIAPGQDGAVHLQSVYDHYVDLSYSQFLSELVDIILFKTQSSYSEDVYIHILSFFTAEVLGIPQLFFVFVAFVYAYFFSGVVLYALKRVEGVKYGWLFYAFVVVFLLWKSIEGINTVRTWTGLWILLYGALMYFETKRWRYLILLAIPPFVHIGYFIMAIPAWIVVLLGTRKWLFIALYFSSFFVQISQTGVVGYLSQTEVGAAKAEGYYIDDMTRYNQKKAETLNSATGYKWFFEFGFQHWAINLVAFILIGFGAYSKQMTTTEMNLFSIGILSQVVSHYTYSLYALSNRSAVVAGLFILTSLILLWKRGWLQTLIVPFKRLQETGLFIAFVILIPFLVFRIADLIYFLSVFLFAFPFIPWINNDMNLSVRMVLGGLLMK